MQALMREKSRPRLTATAICHFDCGAIILHRLPLGADREASMTCYAQGDHTAVRLLFDRFDNKE